MATGGASYQLKTGENKAMAKAWEASERSSAQDSPCELGTIPKWANSLWERLHFCVHVGGSDLDVIEFDSSVLDICKVQYSLSKKQIGQTVALLDTSEYKMKLGQRKNGCAVDIVIKNDNATKSVQYLVDNAFKKVISRFESKHYGSQEPLRLSLLRQFQDNVPTEIGEEVMIYICRKSNQLFVVGEKEKLIQFITKRLSGINDMRPSDKTSAGPSRVNYIHKLKFEQSLVLHYLGFEMFIERKYEDISVYISLKPPQYEIICPNEYDDQKWGDEIKSFLSKLKHRKIKIAHPLMIQLLFHEEYFPNQQLYVYVKKILKEHNVSFVFLRNSSDRVCVVCLDVLSVDLVENFVKTHIRYLNDLFISSDSGRKDLVHWKTTQKLVFEKCKPNGESVNICCTADIMNSIRPPHFQVHDEYSIPSIVAEFLGMFGQEIIANIEVKFNTCIYVSYQAMSVYMYGGTNDMAESKKELMNTMSSLYLSIPTAISKEYLQKKQSVVDFELKSKGCCWKLKPLNGQQRISSYCALQASWHDPLQEKNVFVVEENLWNVDIDLQILFTTDSLNPVEDSSQNQAGNSSFEKFLDFKKQFSNTNSQQNVGFTTDLLTDVKNVGFATNYIVGIVVWSGGSTGKAHIINKDELRTALDAIFQKAIKTKISSIGISSSFIANSVDLTLIQQFVEYFMVDKSIVGKVTDLVVSTDKNTHQVKKHVKNSLKASRGICRKKYSEKEKSAKDSDYKLNVKLGYLHEHKSDVFVNTTNEKLNLDVGALSKCIRDLAGPELQSQCKIDYPTGISHGEVAVTDSYQLGKSKCGFKKIYHIALKKYDRRFYREDIEKCVKKCLSLAERDKFSKISFPAFGVGKLGYPRREVAACMVDAANDFCTQCVNPSLKKIKFVVRGDEETENAFTDEVWRHSKAFWKDTGKSKPIVTSDFRSLDHDLGHLCVKIVTKADYGTPPSYFVKLFFKGDGVAIKRASCKDCLSWNDELHLGGMKSLQSFKARLENEAFHQMMTSERITVAAIYPDERMGFTEGLQAKTIVEFFRTNSFPMLEEVHIVVSGEDAVHSAAKHLELDMTLFKKKMKPHCCLNLIGKSKEALKQAEAYLVALEENLDDHKGASLPSPSMVTSLPSPSMVTKHAGQIKTDTSSVTDEKITKEASDNDLLLDTTHEVTAQINPGLVSLNKNSSQWKKWIGEMEAQFHVEIDVKNIKSDRCYACGSLDNIIEFENHLNGMLTDKVSNNKKETFV